MIKFIKAHRFLLPSSFSSFLFSFFIYLFIFFDNNNNDLIIMLWKRIMMVKVIRFPFQSNQSNIYVSKRKKKRNLTNLIQKKKKKKKRKDENKSKKLGGGGGELWYLSSCLWNITQQNPSNFEAKVIKILKYSSGQLTIAKNLIFWMKLVKLTNKIFINIYELSIVGSQFGVQA